MLANAINYITISYLITFLLLLVMCSHGIMLNKVVERWQQFSLCSKYIDNFVLISNTIKLLEAYFYYVYILQLNLKRTYPKLKNLWIIVLKKGAIGIGGRTSQFQILDLSLIIYIYIYFFTTMRIETVAVVSEDKM